MKAKINTRTKKGISDKAAPSSATTQTKKHRREILASIAAAGAVSSLPSKWTMPVVDHALLPAHAQTSLMTATTQGIANCDSGRLRTRIYEFTIAAAATATGTATTEMDITSNDVGFFVCTDPAGGTTSEVGTGILTFTSTTVSWVLSEGITNLTETVSVSSNTSTATTTYTTTV